MLVSSKPYPNLLASCSKVHTQLIIVTSTLAYQQDGPANITPSVLQESFRSTIAAPITRETTKHVVVS